MKSHVLSLLMACICTNAQAEPLDTFQDCPECPEMIELPLGEFVMGAPEGEFTAVTYLGEQRREMGSVENPIVRINEGPQNRVVVDVRIAMGKNEVTFDEWMACVDDGGCGGFIPRNLVGGNGILEEVERSLTDPRFTHTPTVDYIAWTLGNNKDFIADGRYPVHKVSTLDAIAYTQWLNEKLGTDTYRLPTEAEWEYAARAGTITRFAQGYEPRPEQANISGEATAFQLGWERLDLRSLSHPVTVDELDAANPWGLRHMSGNVSEVTLSCYSDETTPLPAWETTGEWLEMSVEDSCDRVIRGGGYVSGMFDSRPAFRSGVEETRRFGGVLGFRIVKELR